MKDHGKIYKVNSHSQSSNKDIKISGKNKHRKLVAKRPEKQEFLDIEKDEEEEQIQLALLISLEELNKNKKPKKKEEVFIDLFEEEEEEKGENDKNLEKEVIEKKEEKEEKEEKKDEELEEDFGICPITKCYMQHPMLTPSGNYYEKKAIIKWIEMNHNDPITREFLTVSMLDEDLEYREKIKILRKKQKNLK